MRALPYFITTRPQKAIAGPKFKGEEYINWQREWLIKIENIDYVLAVDLQDRKLIKSQQIPH